MPFTLPSKKEMLANRRKGLVLYKGANGQLEWRPRPTGPRMYDPVGGTWGAGRARTPIPVKPKPAAPPRPKPYGPDNPMPNRTIAGPIRSSMPDGWGGGYTIIPLKRR